MKIVILLVLKLLFYIPGIGFRLWQYSKHPDRYPIKTRSDYLRDKLSLILKKAHVTVDAQGLDNLPKKGGYIIYSNHQSNFDPLLIISQVQMPISVVSKIELKKVPLVGNAIRSIGGLFMDRKDLRQSLSVINQVVENVSNGLPYIIFPEGTRTLSQEMLPFKPGAFKAAMKAKVPIVPVCISNVYSIMEIPQKKPHVFLRVLKPIPYQEYQKMKSMEIAELVKSRIQEALDHINKK